MKQKLVHVGVLISSFFGYLGWGSDQHSFLFEAEYQLFSTLFFAPQAVLHPFTILPFLGQLLMVITLVQCAPSKRLTYFSIACLGVLLGFMFLIGLITLHIKTLASTIPFFIFSVVAIRELRMRDTK